MPDGPVESSARSDFRPAKTLSSAIQTTAGCGLSTTGSVFSCSRSVTIILDKAGELLVSRLGPFSGPCCVHAWISEDVDGCVEWRFGGSGDSAIYPCLTVRGPQCANQSEPGRVLVDLKSRCVVQVNCLSWGCVKWLVGGRTMGD